MYQVLNAECFQFRCELGFCVINGSCSLVDKAATTDNQIFRKEKGDICLSLTNDLSFNIVFNGK